MNITTTTYKEPLQVAIIGAGLGGLCLAQGLKKNGIAFQVFEKDSAANSRTQGYRIRIDKTGQDALAACLPERLYTLFSETVVPSTEVRTLNAQLELLTDKWVDSWQDNEANESPDLKANRLTMREILLLGLNRQVHFDKKFEKYEKQPDGLVCIYFEDGTSFTADVLVAADGINSRLGAQRFPAHELVDTGSVCVYGKTFYTEQAKEQVNPVLQTNTSVIFENEIAVIADAMQFKSAFAKARELYGQDAGLTYTEDYMYWALIGTRGRFGLDNEQALTFASGELFDCLKQVTSAWAPTLKALFDAANPESLTMVPVKTALPKDTWNSDNITALGDSIHAMSPAGGLGANSALYDAAILTACLARVVTRETTLLAAIAQYEEQMREHSCNAINTSQQGGKKLYKQAAD
jgi:2-polyprenyl-6-methoxyphenol hydroxylase-like FAD-dependent oxidoreductase